MDENVFYQRRDFLMGCFDKEKGLMFIREVSKRNEPGLWKKWKIMNFACWYKLAHILSIFGRLGVVLAYPITLLVEPILFLLSLWIWTHPLYKKNDFIMKETETLVNSAYHWWYYRMCDEMKKGETGVLYLDENLVPLGVVEYDGWELGGFSLDERICIIKMFADGVKKHLTNSPDGIDVPDVLYDVVMDIKLKKEGDQFVLRGTYNYASAAQAKENAKHVVFRL